MSKTSVQNMGQVPTVVLDDDPTGTQMATDVWVLLSWSAKRIAELLSSSGSLYIQTNSRALPEEEAVELAHLLNEAIIAASQTIGQNIRVVLRGDSTLRGHVFAESRVFAGESDPILFVPAFPQGGRTTKDSVHFLEIDGKRIPVGETEFAKDPVFGYESSNLVDWVQEKGNAAGVGFPLDELRETKGQGLADLLVGVPGGTWVLPDVETDGDIELIFRAIEIAEKAGTSPVIRCAATLAATCAGVLSESFLERPIKAKDNAQNRKVLVVCGSHTNASTQQLSALCDRYQVSPIEVSTDEAYMDANAAGRNAAKRARTAFEKSDLVILSSERNRRETDNSLSHGQRVMTALITAASEVLTDIRTVVSKGGITSAEVAKGGLGAADAFVRGQVAAGISVWDLSVDGKESTQIVVPGNVGDENTLIDVIEAIGNNFLVEEKK